MLPPWVLWGSALWWWQSAFFYHPLWGALSEIIKMKTLMRPLKKQTMAERGDELSLVTYIWQLQFLKIIRVHREWGRLWHRAFLSGCTTRPHHNYNQGHPGQNLVINSELSHPGILTTVSRVHCKPRGGQIRTMTCAVKCRDDVNTLNILVLAIWIMGC